MALVIYLEIKTYKNNNNNNNNNNNDDDDDDDEQKTEKLYENLTNILKQIPIAILN
ncbi:hypothetical protein [Mesomycoplasma hyopneumoniae]|uniref:hypothetical protein n=1 Tax=Mesomycoplasma hyopneumoniae TaxID=2099 RepID=UPI00137083F2|nr:hypothetical protein [Mesomycoplasma hyopneumoniae]